MEGIDAVIQQKIDGKTKPLGALGELERLAKKIGVVQGTSTPKLSKPHLFVFAGDHGIAKEGVSAYPSEVTAQMVLNFTSGGAAINVFCRQNAIDLTVVDAGVNFDFDSSLPILHKKVGYGSQSFLTGNALSSIELEQCLSEGKMLAREQIQSGSNVLGFGEMGIGNTSASAMVMHEITGEDLSYCVGRGTGVNDDQLINKLHILRQSKKHHGDLSSIDEIMRAYMGYEMAMMTGAFLEAASHQVLLLVDGFIATSCFLAASQMLPGLKQQAVFCHESQESGHRSMLDFLGAEPLLKLDLRLGEGTGCALAYPLLQSAVAFLNEMASFEEAGVSNKS